MVHEQTDYRFPYSGDTKRNRRALIATSWFGILLGLNIIKLEKLAFSAGEISPQNEKWIFIALGLTIIYLLFIFLPSALHDFFLWFLEHQRHKGENFWDMAPELFPEGYTQAGMYHESLCVRDKVWLKLINIRNSFFEILVPKLLPIKVYSELIFPIAIALFSLYSIMFKPNICSLL